MNEKILEMLKNCGIPVHLKGYRYLKSAINKCISEPDTLSYGVTKVLYPAVAKEFHTTASSVERGIRHAIEVAFNNMRPATIDKLFGMSISYEKGKATNAQFIATISELLRDEVATI